MNILAIAFYLTIALIGFLFSKNKVVNILLCLVVVALFGLSVDDNDFWVYMNIYDGIGYGYSSDYEVGYVFINLFFNKLGVNYITFRLILGIFFCTILFFVVRKATEHPNMVWSCYLIYSAMFDACLLRNSIAFVFALLGVIALMKVKSVGSYIAPCVLFTLAALVHSAYWAFVFFVPMWYMLNNIKHGVEIVLASIIALYVVCVVANNIVFDIYSRFQIREATIDKYMTNSYANVAGAMYGVLKYLLIVSPVLYVNIKTIPRLEIASNIPQMKVESAKMTRVNILFSFFLIPQFFTITFSRLFRILIFINYIYISTLCLGRKSSQVKALAFLYALVFVLFTIVYESPTSFSDVVLMHLNTNPLFYFCR